MKLLFTVLASSLVLAGVYAPLPAAAATDAASAIVKPGGEPGMKVDAQIRTLHAQLRITAAEETQWTAVAQAMRDSARGLDTAIDQRATRQMTASAVEDLNAYGAIAQAHADGVKQVAAAFAPLYASMSDMQKEIADETFAHRAHKAHKLSSAAK